MKQRLTTPICHKLPLLLLTVLIKFPVNCTQDTYYIKPTPDTLCPGEPCLTLSEYGVANFSSNTTSVFLPGYHNLNYTISVGTVSNFEGSTHSYPLHTSLTLLGNSSSLPEVTSRIVCSWPAGFVFSGITELYIDGLAFISCGHNDSAAVNIHSVQSVSISNCTFQNNINSHPEPSNYGFGGAIYVHNSTLMLIGNTFEWNFAYQGGALGVHANSILTLSQNIFQDNFADYVGGALYANEHNTLTLSVNTFQNNSADYAGGALYVHQHNTLNVSEEIFRINSAVYGGCFSVYVNNTITLSENIFQNNRANYSGGAVYVHKHSNLSVSENVFQMNSAVYGGCYYAHVNNTITLAKNIFQNNTAESSGGALYTHEHNALTVTENTFQTNSADNGGACYVHINNTFSLSKNMFQSNSAFYGGALETYTNSTLTLLKNTFQNNSAYNGGGIFASINNILTLTENAFYNNSADNGGGALYAHKPNILNVSVNTFEMNSALYGGSCYAYTNNTITLTANTFQTNSADYGGVVFACTSNTLTLSQNILQKNSADISGGALYAHEHNTFTVSENIFQMNSAVYGGCYHASINNTVTLSKNIFQNCTADISGGAVYTDQHNTLSISENTFQMNSAIYGGAYNIHINNTITLTKNVFQSNTAAYGGALEIYTNSTLALSNNVFQNNSAIHGGVLLSSLNNTLNVSENTFRNNFAIAYGGALFASTNSTLTLIGNTIVNCTSYGGGALYVSQSTIHLSDNTFNKNVAHSGGGAIFCLSNSTLKIHGSHKLQNNVAQYGGGITALQCQMTLDGDLLFENNAANYGAGLYTDQSWVNGYAKFSNNVAGEDGGGIYASGRSRFYFKERIIFVGNSALNGGGLLLTEGSNLYLQPNTTIDFTNNLAKHTGGAIKSDPLSLCVEVPCGYFAESECFFQVQTQRKYDIFNTSEITELRNIRLNFDNNTAFYAGAALYGGLVDNCSLDFINQQLPNGFQPHRCPQSGEVFDYITNFDQESLEISSDPIYICTCDDGEPDCSFPFITRSVYPGGRIEVPITAYGQRRGTTPAVIHVTAQDEITIDEPQDTQKITNNCTILQYTVKTRHVGTTQQMILYADGLCPPKEKTVSSVPTNVINIHVKILNCPPGFELSRIEPVCICAQRIQRFTNTCRLDDKRIDRTINTESWVGYTQDNTSDGLILHPHCPLDYCTSNKLFVAVEDSDEQCSNNRTGLLCGKCDQNFSLVLGTNRCLKCSSDYLWLIVAFAFVGIALVFLLLVLRLTVAAGTINGLIFYANVFAMNSATFFRPHNTNILTVFIAWLNLDLGLETCFYDGMDAYTKAWLQFAFPLYVWALVGAIMFVSHYSSKAATILGTNPIAVLATLFLLSYAKFLRAIIVALSYTLLEYPNNSKITVWLYNGNIRYLGSEHIPLFIASLACLIVLFLPYTILLTFSQWLRSKSGQGRWKIFSWVNHHRVLPFVEAYHAPYTDKHRYWTGLMLLVRCILFFAFALNALGDPSVNLLAIGLVTAVLTVLYALLGNRVYKSWYLNVLELSFIVNLGILALATLYILSTGGNQNTVTLTSIAITFATFIGIVTYHIVQQIKNISQLWKRMLSRNDNYECIPRNREDSHLDDSLSPPDKLKCCATVTYTDLSEWVDPSRLREPCMEMDT